jgi:hypothetical protein
MHFRRRVLIGRPTKLLKWLYDLPPKAWTLGLKRNQPGMASFARVFNDIRHNLACACTESASDPSKRQRDSLVDFFASEPCRPLPSPP